jgi:hypothetical protein
MFAWRHCSTHYWRVIPVLLGVLCCLFSPSVHAGQNRWSSSGPTHRTLSISTFAIDPLTPAILYAGTFQGVFKSVDAGANWTLLSTGGFHSLQAFSLAIDPHTPTMEGQLDKL